MVKVSSFPHKKVNAARKLILNLVEEVGVDRFAIAFNGGKDSIVLQHLVRSSIGMNTNIKLVFWHVNDEFEDVTNCINDFLNESSTLDITHFSDPNEMFKDVQQLVEQGTEYIFLGTRSEDLKVHETREYQKPMWGGGTRVMPLMYFTIQDIGNYLHYYKIRYPSYYREGYTSLGTIKSTIRNPFLYDRTSKTFEPAWSLRHPMLERANRAYINKKIKIDSAAIQCSMRLDPVILDIAISEIQSRGFQDIEIFHFDRDTMTLRAEFKYVWVFGSAETLASL